MSFHRYFNYKNLFISLFFAWVPLVGLLVFSWSGEEMLVYFIAEIYLGMVFHFFKVILHPELLQQIKSKTSAEEYKKHRNRILFYVFVAKLLRFVAEFVLFAGITTALLGFLALVVYEQGETFWSKVSISYISLALIVGVYLLDLLVNYVLLQYKNKVTVDQLTRERFGGVFLLFVSVFAGIAVFGVVRNTAVFALGLVIVRIMGIVIVELLRAGLGYLKERFPALEVKLFQ